MKRKRDVDQSLEGPLESSEVSIAGTSFHTTALDIACPTEELAGKIEFLQTINFMCHRNLKVPFSSGVTFVTGMNGSGKSAIMAALIVVLGGSTSLTSRGSKVTDFIKKGESSAKVTISLINEGRNSYKKEVYGSRIVISRNISSTGNTWYACKAASGDIVSKKKEEVDAIVLALNLQIRNPICVLNQDVARDFLCATDNKLRFAMFLQATQLEELKAIYAKSMEQLVQSKKHLTTKQKGIEEAAEEVQKLREKFEHFEKMRERIRERMRLENEYFWALVADEEKNLKKLLDNQNELVGKKEECTRLETNFEDILKEVEESLKECQARLQEGKTDKVKKTEVKSRIQREIHEIERQIEKVEHQLRVIKERMARQLADINGLKEHLRENANSASQNQAEKEEAKKKIKLLQERMSEIIEEMAKANRELERTEDENYEHAQSLENMKADLGELEQNQRRLEHMLEGTKAKGENNLLKFGKHTPELMRAIEEGAKKNYFHKKPVGPCGIHVRLTGDPKWARAVESVVGGLMNSYLCDNQKDFQVLSEIMDKICGKKQPPIIIGKFLRGRHNVEPRKVSARGLPSILDVLSFDNDLVFNAFIDQARIETILLFETDQQAASILTNIQNVPKNLKMGVTLQGDQYYPPPNYRTYAGNPTRLLRYFDVASKGDDAVKRFENELREVKQALLGKRSDIQRAREATVEMNKALDRHKSKLKTLIQEKARVQLELSHLRDIEETIPVVITQVALEEELQGLEEKHQKSSEEATQCSEELERLNRERVESVKRLNLAVMEEDAAERSNIECEEVVEERKSKLRKLVRERKGASDRLAGINERLREVEQGIRKSEAAVEVKTKEAEKICPERINTERTAVEVHKKLEECERYLKAAEKVAGSREDAIEEYKTKCEVFKDMKRTAEIFDQTIETLTKAALTKIKNLDNFQQHVANLVSLYFQAILQTRGYDGELKVDFENKVLDLEVKPRDATLARKDSKTLSGGERSYATVSFILAIWKAVEMPFYFLDEFDVFMDKVNRTVIMHLLLAHAKAQTNKQFVFITPQDISGFQLPDNVAVYRMPDPERKS